MPGHDLALTARAPLLAGLVLAAVAGLSAVAAGCGGGSDRTTTATAQVPPVSLSIDEPDGGTVDARVLDGRWVADVPIAGHSQPGSILRVTTGCAEPACEMSADADAQGRWQVTLRAESAPAKPYVRIIAELAGESAIGLVRLKPEAGSRGRRGSRGPASRGGSGRSGSGSGSASRGSAEGVEGVPVPPPPPTLPEASNPPRGSGGSSSGGASSLLLVGDSLAVGIQPLLPGQLPGWTVLTDARQDRTLAEGMARWRVEHADEAVDAFSLFTNDNPGNLAALESAVRETARDGCAVWATIARRTSGGDSYAAANALLQRLALELGGRLAIVPWAQTVAEHPEWLGRDGVHPNDTGYRARAQLYAQAARTCG